MSVVEMIDVDIEKEIKEFPLVPYTQRVYIIEDEVFKSHGLYIPDSSRKEGEMQTNIGTVVAVADDIGFVKPGDRVLYARYSGSWVLDQKYRVMNEEDILGRYK